MKRRLREPFGKAGLIVAAIALVFAMLGGAYAASNDASSDATASAKKNQKAKKGPRGPRGKTGPAGPAGPVGPAGPAGAKGDKGDSGSSGTNGKSVTVGSAGAECAAGGATVQVEGEPATKKAVCNGEDGETGFTETLPSGKTETGAWSILTGDVATAISFPIPLAEEIPPSAVVYMAEGETGGTGCTGGTAADPKADPGFLCVYAATGGVLADFMSIRYLDATEGFDTGASKTGAMLTTLAAEEDEAKEFGYVAGSFAVTAP